MLVKKHEISVSELTKLVSSCNLEMIQWNNTFKRLLLTTLLYVHIRNCLNKDINHKTMYKEKETKDKYPLGKSRMINLKSVT